jgi:hypothetical protein
MKAACALQLEGSHDWTLAELADLCEGYHGECGRFAYAAVRWTLEAVYDGKPPLPLVQWALTAYGHCIGLTHARREALPVVTLHPIIWTGGADPDAPPRPHGPRYALDVVIHDLLHVHILYVLGGWRGKSSHDSPLWCSEIMRLSPRLELSAFQAAPTVRRRVKMPDGTSKMKRATPEGCAEMADIARWPHAFRPEGYYKEARQGLPFSW